ncbi:hypothetical protein IF188_03785 [Microbacterium sp. NEAU-LLC]|uniref:Secreted protein n=1 Tax=Microbacterium helvum TaxID=2773713 RepID=A0ABR8NM21_9MICO|nr:hypothetical protein [Microbacterium helvum]MBD3940822.1 hypothetical protein [Microbacterium helvum]
MILRATTATLGLAAAAVMLSGCLAPAPEPTPTPTAVFASEAEAFAAAEETYRAYVDAENARWADANSEPSPESFLVAAALDEEIDVNRQFDEAGMRATGQNRVDRVDGVEADLRAGDVSIDVCLDVTDSAVVNADGEDVTPPDRAPQLLVRADLTTVGSGLLIERTETRRDDGC